ncbi:MAG: cytochrome c [Pirellulaceae bacterium]|nr:MAG: cytochrome c [Pirellulaceae bacterium]
MIKRIWKEQELVIASLGAALLGITLLVGCERVERSTAVEFEPNWVYAYQIGQRSEQAMDQAVLETQAALTELFGTPDEPKIPAVLASEEEFADLMTMEHLMAASGPPEEQGRGLFRKHCAVCHGVTGNGRGPTAALLNPYPRDFRLGKFKFKSTPIGVKPTKEDIADTIRHGIPGTTMVKIPELSDEDIAALTDYVIYLSMRGEVERSLLFEAGELVFAEGESLYNPALKETDPEAFEEQWEIIQDYVLDTAESWIEAPEEVVDIPQRDPAVVPETTEQLLAKIRAGDEAVLASVARGRELFLSEKASCAKCHGKEGRGDGQTNDYDDWAKEWTKKFGLDYEDEFNQVPLIARGALPVRKIQPRNFEEGVFRGGSAPEELYQRIALGIEGTPMPAAAAGSQATLTPEDVWDLVNYIRSLYQPKSDQEGTDTQAEALART